LALRGKGCRWPRVWAARPGPHKGVHPLVAAGLADQL
jgi:hypothetical protein